MRNLIHRGTGDIVDNPLRRRGTGRTIAAPGCTMGRGGWSWQRNVRWGRARASGAPPLGPLKRFTSAFSALASVGVYGAAIINACFLNDEIVSEELAEGKRNRRSVSMGTKHRCTA